MNLLIDGRALQSNIRSGVPRVAEWLVKILAENRGEHKVTLLTTGWKKVALWPTAYGPRPVHLKIPNKLLHLSLFLFNWPKLDKLVTRQTHEKYDAVLLPNLHFFASEAPFALVVHDLSFLILPEFFSPFERFVHALKRPLVKIKKAKWLFAVSNSTAQDIKQSSERTDVNIIDISESAQLKEKTTPVESKNRCDFVFISTTEPRKNLESTILGYLGHIGLHGKGTVPCGFGDSPLCHEDRLLIIGAITKNGRAIQKKFAAHKNIIWLGKIDDEARNKLIGRAKAVIYPSRFEGYGLPIVEAQNLGTPVITSNRTSMPEVAPDAILIDPHRPETITLALRALAQNVSLRPTACGPWPSSEEIAKKMYNVLSD
ncbi:MAG: glycosyltransferase family 1 protein [bacterium]